MLGSSLMCLIPLLYHCILCYCLLWFLIFYSALYHAHLLRAFDMIWYDMTILMCAQKLTDASLTYRTGPKTKTSKMKKIFSNIQYIWPGARYPTFCPGTRWREIRPTPWVTYPCFLYNEKTAPRGRRRVAKSPVNYYRRTPSVQRAWSRRLISSHLVQAQRHCNLFLQSRRRLININEFTLNTTIVGLIYRVYIL